MLPNIADGSSTPESWDFQTQAFQELENRGGLSISWLLL